MDATSSAESTYYLLYHSQATEGLLPSEVLALVTQAQAANLSAGITGLLCYSEGLFVQLLEGPEKAVRELYAKVQFDLRHRQVTQLRAGVRAQRCFAQWSMAFTEISPLEYYWFVHQVLSYPGTQAAAQELIDNPLLLVLLAGFQ